jgi:hypothetical protein
MREKKILKNCERCGIGFNAVLSFQRYCGDCRVVLDVVRKELSCCEKSLIFYRKVGKREQVERRKSFRNFLRKIRDSPSEYDEAIFLNRYKFFWDYRWKYFGYISRKRKISYICGRCKGMIPVNKRTLNRKYCPDCSYIRDIARVSRRNIMKQKLRVEEGTIIHKELLRKEDYYTRVMVNGTKARNLTEFMENGGKI